MANLLSLPERASLSVDETDCGGLLICQTDTNGEQSSVLVYKEDASRLADAINAWLVSGRLL